jgi:hypothetical protein
MPGTSENARRAAITKKKRYGKYYFHRLGKLGGNPLLLKVREEKLHECH